MKAEKDQGRRERSGQKACKNKAPRYKEPGVLCRSVCLSTTLLEWRVRPGGSQIFAFFVLTAEKTTYQGRGKSLRIWGHLPSWASDALVNLLPCCPKLWFQNVSLLETLHLPTLSLWKKELRDTRQKLPQLPNSPLPIHHHMPLLKERGSPFLNKPVIPRCSWTPLLQPSQKTYSNFFSPAHGIPCRPLCIHLLSIYTRSNVTASSQVRTGGTRKGSPWETAAHHWSRSRINLTDGKRVEDSNTRLVAKPGASGRFLLTFIEFLIQRQ